MSSTNLVFSGADLTSLINIHGVDYAFRELIIRFDPVVTTDIVNYLGFKNCPDPGPHGEDVRQLTWKAVYLDIEKYHRGDKNSDYINPAAWLFRIRRRFCIQDIYRHIQERKILSLDQEDFSELRDETQFTVHPFINSPVESKHYAKEVLEFVRAYFFNLPKEQKIAFELFINGFTHKEIAFFLEITPERSRQWISRAARRIKRRIC